jgi:hypothetical protein
MSSPTSERVLARFLQASEAIPKGTQFEVVMKHGDWWSEMRKGSILVAQDAGTFGAPLTFKERGDSHGSGFPMTPTKVKDKIRLVGKPYGGKPRDLTVTMKTP